MIGQLRRNDFIRDVTILAVGLGGAQAITIAVAPLLTRLYTPHDLGILALFAASSIMFSMTAAWRYDFAVTTAKTDGDAANLLGLSCLIVLLMTALAAALLVVGGDLLVRAFNAPDLEPYLFLVPLAILVSGLSQPLAWWAARRQHYKHASASQIIRSAGGSGLQISFGLAKAGAGGLILGNLLGQMIAIVILAVGIWPKDGRLIVASLNRKEMWRLARENSDYPKYSMPRALLFSAAQMLTPILLAKYFGTMTAGGYYLAGRICQTPLIVLGDAVRRVFCERAAARFNRGEGLLAFLTNSTIGLGLCIIAPFAVVVAFAPPLFQFAFGADWVRAGAYAQWLVIPWFFRFICTPSLILIQIYGQQRMLLMFDGTTLIPRLAVIPAAYYVADDLMAIAIYSIVDAVFHLCILIFVFLHTWRHHVSLAATAPAKTLTESASTAALRGGVAE